MTDLQNLMAATHFQLLAGQECRRKGAAMGLGCESWVLFPEATGQLRNLGPCLSAPVPSSVRGEGGMATRLNDVSDHNLYKIAQIPSLPCSPHLLYLSLLFSKAFHNTPSLFFFFLCLLTRMQAPLGQELCILVTAMVFFLFFF